MTTTTQALDWGNEQATGITVSCTAHAMVLTWDSNEMVLPKAEMLNHSDSDDAYNVYARIIANDGWVDEREEDAFGNEITDTTVALTCAVLLSIHEEAAHQITKLYNEYYA